jgi:hypothetical protein
MRTLFSSIAVSPSDRAIWSVSDVWLIKIDDVGADVGAGFATAGAAFVAGFVVVVVADGEDDAAD